MEKLFRKSVPHVLENIFFSLDYDSSMECRKVCKEWSELLSFDRYEMEAKKMLMKFQSRRRLRRMKCVPQMRNLT